MLLYSFVEVGKTLLAKPLEQTSRMLEPLFAPPSPWALAPGAKEAQAFLNITARIHKSYQRPAWGIDSVKTAAGVQRVSIQTVLEKPFGRLIHFKKEERRKEEPTLLIVAPMSGHYPTLLRDTVKYLLPEHNVFLTEWINARDVPLSEGEFSFEDYVHYLMEFLRILKQQGHQVHLMSVCQPTVPSLVAQSLLAQSNDPAQAVSMIMIGGPIDARKSPTAVTNFALEHDLRWFERNLISMVPLPYGGAGRLVYPGFLQHMGFIAMNPGRHAVAHQKYFDHLTAGDESSAEKHREFYDEYNAVMDLPKTYYLQTIEKVFQKFELPLGTMHIAGQRVCPEAISKCALLSIEGQLDDISGAGQTHAVHTLCTGVPAQKRQQHTVEGVGHYGVFSGSKFEKHIVPLIAAFTKKHNS